MHQAYATVLTSLSRIGCPATRLMYRPSGAEGNKLSKDQDARLRERGDQDARLYERGAITLAVIALAIILLLPALWNGYPLLQYDTGGYLARWYEGYLVPSRSTTYGLYLHLGEHFHFWINLAAQAAAVLWIAR